MTVVWKAQVSSAVGMIWAGGSRNPYTPEKVHESILLSKIFAK